MSENRRNRRKKNPQNRKGKITKKDKLYGIFAMVLLVIASFLLYFFILKDTIHKH